MDELQGEVFEGISVCLFEGFIYQPQENIGNLSKNLQKTLEDFREKFLNESVQKSRETNKKLKNTN